VLFLCVWSSSSSVSSSSSSFIPFSSSRSISSPIFPLTSHDFPVTQKARSFDPNFLNTATDHPVLPQFFFPYFRMYSLCFRPDSFLYSFLDVSFDFPFFPFFFVPIILFPIVTWSSRCVTHQCQRFRIHHLAK